MDPERRPAVAATSAGGRPPAEVLAIRLRQALPARQGPLVVGVDGRSGAGKSTLTAQVAAYLARHPDGVGRVTVVEGDDFYAGGSAGTWDARTAPERVDLVIDWHRQRDVLERLRADGVARWRGFDWDSEHWDAEVAPLTASATTAVAAPLILLEGAYSCRPELHPLLDLRVLLTAPGEVRLRRLVQRDGDDHDAGWTARWSAAEDHYFGSVMPPERFDLVLGAG
ncbi:uridine kinase [Pseudonocardia sp. ICBG1293]|uniref:uridine kinase family protein n=1 Tax=Pseudonocardia sp. ICBG1293 TaxID=2844382 RepID=UPI001CCFD698|nr:hypothetical protein [Pseudonocardia sp. ICBG1293]